MLAVRIELWTTCDCIGTLRCRPGRIELRQTQEWVVLYSPCDKGGGGYSSCMPRQWDRQRGGWVTGAARLTEPSHVPTEPCGGPLLQQQVFSSAQFTLCASGRRRGGWVSGAVRRTDPSHVPTEPPQGFDFWYQKDVPVPGPCQWYTHAVLFFPDGSFDCMDPRGRSSRLTVRVRKPVWLWELYNHGATLLCGFEQIGFSLGVTARIHLGSAFQECVVISPCLHGGLLNTLLEQFASGDYASCLFCTGDVGPYRLAGPLVVLQRQILLPGVLIFSGFDSLAPSVCVSSHGATSDYRAIATLNQHADFDRGRPGNMDKASHSGGSLQPTWVHLFGSRIQAMLDACALSAVLFLQSLLVECGTCLLAMCRAGCMLMLCYLCRLLLFGWRLKGGTCNCDNILLGARSATAAVPWRFGVSLIGFSPRLQSGFQAAKCRGGRRPHYSADLFLLIFLIAACVNPAAAANWRGPAANPTEFPAAPVHQDQATLDRGLLQDPNVADEIVPDPGVVGPPPTIYITRAYRLMGFGHQPEYISSTTASTTTLHRCLELLETDLGVQHPRVLISEAIDLFKIRVEAVEGYRLWLKGGRKRQGWLVAEHRSKFWVKLEAQEVEYASDYSGSTGTSDDSSSEDSGHAPGPGPSDLFLSGATADAEEGAHRSSDAAHSNAPSEDGAPSHHCLCSSRTLAMLDCERLDMAMWNRASDQNALVQGKQGDTSDCIQCERSLLVLSAVKKYRLPTKLSPCIRLWLFGATLLTQFQVMQAGKGPDGYLAPTTFTSGLMARGDRQVVDCPGEHFPLDVGIGKSESLFHIGVLVTLLEEAKDEGFVVVCQFVSDLWGLELEQCATRKEPYRLSLESAIPRTAFQDAVKELQDLLPKRSLIAPDQWQDWLDCDLLEVHAACKACPAIWEWLSKYGSWYDEVFTPEVIHVYTDGSACQAAGGHAVSASWAFNVWALTATRQAYLGHAFGVTAHACSPFHLGEKMDDALTGEQLALAWAFC